MDTKIKNNDKNQDNNTNIAKNIPKNKIIKKNTICKFGLYCSKHKLENMIDVIHKKCNFNGCFKIPLYNVPDIKKGIYCSKHKLENMVDVINKRCKKNNCTSMIIVLKNHIIIINQKLKHYIVMIIN